MCVMDEDKLTEVLDAILGGEDGSAKRLIAALDVDQLKDLWDTGDAVILYCRREFWRRVEEGRAGDRA